MSQPATAVPRASPAPERPFVSFDAHPDRYAHWKLAFDGPVATLTLDIDEDRGIAPGYKLKLNSYDLGVDIELADALQRIRFEHPEVRSVIVTSGKERIFCSGANIFMLGLSSHAWKVNFCKFTNETRNGIEDSSRHSGLKFVAACNGTTAGGGYELALACDEIILIDDRSSAVSLPEVPLLGVLPGTGGLTRVTDKRRVRRDHADVFCTLVEGVRAARAKEWRLIDDYAKPQQFADRVQRARAGAGGGERPPAGCHGHRARAARTDHRRRRLSLRPRRRALRPRRAQRDDHGVGAGRGAAGATSPGSTRWARRGGRSPWRASSTTRSCCCARTSSSSAPGSCGPPATPSAVLAVDATLERHAGDWFVRETIGMLRRTLARLDVTSRTLYALIEPGSCFAGTLLELALAADRAYMLAVPDGRTEDGRDAPRIAASALNFGAYPMVNGLARIAARFYDEPAPIARVKDAAGRLLAADDALDLGLVTAAPDELDWDDEIRVALEERASLSPDALTGMEASLRFGGVETMETRVFGRLSAWQNWIFIRPNATGATGALKVFGTGSKAKFDRERV